MNPTNDIYKSHNIKKGKDDEPIDGQHHHRPNKIQRLDEQQQLFLHPSHDDDDDSFIEGNLYYNEEHKSDTIITSYSSNNNNTTTIHSNSEQQQQQQIIQFHHQQQYKRVLINQLQSLIHDFNHNNNHNNDNNESNIIRIDDFAQQGIELFTSYYRSSSSRSSSNVQSKEIIQNDQQGVGQQHNFPTTNTNDRKVYQVLQQLHGILFLWLDYIMSSSSTTSSSSMSITHGHPISSIVNSSSSSTSSVWDITNIDCYQIQQKLITATNHICTCIIEIYRFVIHHNQNNNMIQEFTSIESLMILIDTLLLLMKPLFGIKNSNHPYNDLLQQILPLLEVIHCTIHHVRIFDHNQHHDNDDYNEQQKQYQQQPISLYVQQQFILCLVQSTYIVSVSASHDAKISSSSSPTMIQSIAYEIIQYLYQELHQRIQNNTNEIDNNYPIHSERKWFYNGNNNNNITNIEILIQYYKVALDVMAPKSNSSSIPISNPGNLHIISNPNVDTTTLLIELFRVQCIVIQLSNSNFLSNSLNIISIIPLLLQTFFNYHNNSTISHYHNFKNHGMNDLLIQHQILDCLVCLAFGWNGMVVSSEQDTVILDTVHTLLSDAFIQLLIDVKTSTTRSSKKKNQIRDTISNVVVLLKRKAIEGLQYLLTSNYNLHDMILHGCTIRNKNENDTDPYIRIQALIQSIFLLCIHDKEYNKRTTYSGEYVDEDDYYYDDDNDDTDHENDIDDDYNVNNELQLYDDLIHDIETYTINDYTITTGTAEILLSILSLALHDYNINNNENIDMNNSSSIYGSLKQIVPVCIELMQYYCNPSTMNEHILHLIIYMICDEYKELFLHHNVIIQYPDLLTSLSLVLQTINLNTFDENDTTIQRRILYYFYELLIHDNNNDLSISSLLVRQDGIILEAITCIISHNTNRFEATSHHHDNNNDHMTNISIQDIAIQIVCILSNNIFDRCILARQPKLLSSMIHYVRNYNNDHHDSTIVITNNNIDTSTSSLTLSTVAINDPVVVGPETRHTASISTNTNANTTSSSSSSSSTTTTTTLGVSTSIFYSREQIKQCIQQLADVL